MSLPFIPRNVATKSKKIQSTKDREVNISSACSPRIPLSIAKGKEQDKPDIDEPAVLNKSSFSDKEYASLISLALSDFALFSDPDLRRKIDEGEDGFVSLLHILKHALHGILISESETAAAKALRSEATDSIEVRMVFSGPSWSAQGSFKNKGMFEVRRKDPQNTFTRENWKERTLYLENIPVQYASLPGVFHLTQVLLTKTTDTIASFNRIQSISIPPHHLDKPGDIPKCKGFALLTLLDVEDVQQLLREWPWTLVVCATDVKPAISEFQEATKFGFRALSKTRWDEMKDEYLAYRARLVKEIVSYEDEMAAHAATKRRRSPSPAISSIPDTVETTLTSSSLFPPKCLVFVRNLHCETNKTTLRALFSKAFTSLPDGLDYVDFTKGMDSCYLRVATPEHARALTDYFTQAKMAQTNGLDSEGSRDAETKAITMETMGGRREEIYWEKVPPKVRHEAVDKALRLLEPETTRKDEGGQKRARRR
ncbi:hypothetical protein ARMGADRAFT_1164773 [Armillaria gallica]|uniref:XRRM domain-containing protein n=1 Tax=Armillaria gallica TaxID=47427 RepID=A0A2H3DFE7_ARMGA|nr:hypothetical protein ARMGADRAFT_1164773 [Armillaria gallica]